MVFNWLNASSFPVRENIIVSSSKTDMCKHLFTYFTVPACPTLSLPHGRIIYTGNLINGKYSEFSSAAFICDNGYLLQGERNAICQSSGSWNQEIPICFGNNIDQF